MAKALSWFRFYAETLHDPKVQRLLAPLFRFWINILCLTCSSGGALPGIPDIAFALRVSEQEAGAAVDELIQAGLLDRTEAGLVPHGWAIRQYLSDCSTERVQKYRKKWNVSETLQRSVSETAPEHIGADDHSISRPDQAERKSSRPTLVRPAPSEKQSTFPPFEPGEFDLPAFFERQYERHPKKSNRNIALGYLEDALRSVTPEVFEAGHIAWCECDQWTDKGGRFVKQDLAQWILDQGWKYAPPGNAESGSASAIAADAMKRASGSVAAIAAELERRKA